eukprot:1479420-Lingulodinium_polyedra.AAC.1
MHLCVLSETESSTAFHRDDKHEHCNSETARGRWPSVSDITNAASANHRLPDAAAMWSGVLA